LFPLFWTLIGGAVKAADISQPGASHPVFHSFALCLLERGEDSRTIQELLRDDDKKPK
jgi:site-specific recombinase XerD